MTTIRAATASVAIALLLLAPAACRSKGDCEKVVSHMVELMKKEAPEGQHAELDESKPELLEACNEETLSKSTETCTLNAKTLQELDSCYR